MKKCFKCEKRKPLTEFYKHKDMKDGHLNKCKECAKLDAKSNRIKNIDYYVEYDKKRAMLPHRVEQRKEYSLTEEGKLAGNRAKKKYVNQYPMRRAANNFLNNAVRDKRIKKPKHCSKCGATGRIHGHHEDYMRPLDVIWVCPPCHRQIHEGITHDHTIRRYRNFA